MRVNIHDLVLYVISVFTRRIGRGIGKTRLMKLLFLIDYYAVKVLGGRLRILRGLSGFMAHFLGEYLMYLIFLRMKD